MKNSFTVLISCLLLLLLCFVPYYQAAGQEVENYRITMTVETTWYENCTYVAGTDNMDVKLIYLEGGVEKNTDLTASAFPSPRDSYPRGVSKYELTTDKKPIRVEFQSTYFTCKDKTTTCTFSIAIPESTAGCLYFESNNVARTCDNRSVQVNGYVITTSLQRPVMDEPVATYCEDESLSFLVNIKPLGQYDLQVAVDRPDNIIRTFYSKHAAGSSYSKTETFTLPTILGTGYQTYLGRPLYFRVRSTLCGSGTIYSDGAGPYTFIRKAPDRLEHLITPPTCPGGTGSVLLNNVYFGTTPYDKSFPMTYVLFSEADRGPAKNVTVTANGQTYVQELAYTYTAALPVRFDGLRPGKYSLQVEPSGKAGNEFCPMLNRPTFEVPDAPALAITQAAPVPKGHGYNVSCPNGDDGAIQVAVTNGKAPFSYQLYELIDNKYVLSPKTPVDAGSVDGCQYTFTHLPAGIYKVTVQDGCGATLAQSQEGIVVTGPPNPLTATVFSSPTRCYREASGSATISISNGFPPYTFEIYREGVVMPGKTTSSIGTGHTFTGLAAGTYTIKVQDNYGCPLNGGNGVNVTVTEPAPVAFTTSLGAASCQGSATGWVRVTATGGNGLYQYSRDNGSNWQNSDLFDHLAAGSYSLLVKDGNGCTSLMQTVTVTQPATLLRFAGSPTLSQPRCSFDKGTIGVSATDGTPFPGSEAYRFFITGRADTLPGNAATFDNLPAGTYTIGVRDASGCMQYTASIVITVPPAITLTPKLTHVSCQGRADGQATFALSGGVSSATNPYQIQWLRAGNASLLKEATATGTTTLTGLTAGNYLIRVKDGNGCSNSPSTEWLEVPFVITEPQALQLLALPTTISCYGETDGSVQLQVQGGTAPYQYSRDGIGYTPSAQFDSLSKGTHSFYVKDANGCSAQTSTQIVEPALLTGQVETIEMVACYGEKSGSFRLTASGGTAPYEASIDDGVTWTSTLHFGQLVAGPYSAIVKDARNCRTTVSLSITQPAPLQVSLSGKEDANCGKTNGWATVGASGGISPYQYAWFDRSGAEVGQGPTLSGVAAGTYRVRVTDAHGCVNAFSQVSLSNVEGPQVRVTGVTPASCYDVADGRATVTVLSGVAPVSIRWPNGQTTGQVNNLSRGSYEVVITDGNGCQSYKLITIDSPAELTVEATALQHPSCYKSCDGALTVHASGGVPPYQYTWSFLAEASPALTGRCAGTYQVIVRDARGCTVGRAFELIQPLPVLVDVPGKVTICAGQAVTLDAGNPGATYQWQSDNGFTSTSQTVTLREAGRYKVKVTLTGGCTGEATTQVITANDLLQADFLAPTEAIAGDTVVLVEISQPEPSSIRWQYGDSVSRIRSAGMYEEVVFPAPGIYTVTLQAGLGDCRASVSKQVKVLGPSIGVSTGRLGYRETGIKQLGIYPNPTNGAFVARVELHEQNRVSLRLTDLQGSHIWASQAAEGQAYYEIPFNVPALKAGVYLLTLQTDNTAKTLRVTVY